MNKIDVIGIGALNADHVYRVDRLLDDGETVITESASFPGGSAANTIYGLARLGISTGFIGAVGNDSEGKGLIEHLRNAGVDTGGIRVKPGMKTGMALCLSDGLGRRSIYVLPGANSGLTANDLKLDYIHHAKMLHVSSFVDDAQFKVLLNLMGKLDSSVGISFAPGALYAARGLETLKPVLARTEILFINQHEISQLTGGDFRDGAGVCLGEGCRIVAVTLGKGDSGTGAATSYIRTADKEYFMEPAGKEVAAVDTTGAGDAFAAGFLYGWLNGKGLEECGHMGNIVAQFSIARMGARQGLPTHEELAERYRRLYKREI